MKMPKTPPSFDKYWSNITKNSEGIKHLDKLLSSSDQAIEATKGRYLHWDKLRHLQTPKEFSSEEWWYTLKLSRRNQYKQIPLWDEDGNKFNCLLTDPVPEMLHKIDQGAGGVIAMDDQITNPDTKDQYYISSLIQEATTSSQLEGAATTRRVAKEMIKTGRKPRDKSEQMILNNYITMRSIGELKNKKLSKDLIFEIHRLITNKTLDDTSQIGRFRNPDEKIVVGDMYNEVIYTPPSAEELDKRLKNMCDFANGKIPKEFIHPVIRSIILHFWLAYDHPFIDGNGRTARALFYWSMLKHGYWLFEFISISQIILKQPTKYYKAFLYTETDDNDLTYFILYHLEVIDRAIKELHEYIKLRTERIQKVEKELRGINLLNHRQSALISHALRHPHQRYTIKSHQTSHNIVYQTSRLDLYDLEDRGLLKRGKVGKTWYFTPADDLEEKLSKMS